MNDTTDPIYLKSKAIWKEYLTRRDIPKEKFYEEWDKLKKQAGSDKVDWKLPTKEVDNGQRHPIHKDI